jgi:hypothetical protein
MFLQLPKTEEELSSEEELLLSEDELNEINPYMFPSKKEREREREKKRKHDELVLLCGKLFYPCKSDLDKEQVKKRVRFVEHICDICSRGFENGRALGGHKKHCGKKESEVKKKSEELILNKKERHKHNQMMYRTRIIKLLEEIKEKEIIKKYFKQIRELIKEQTTSRLSKIILLIICYGIISKKEKNINTEISEFLCEKRNIVNIKTRYKFYRKTSTEKYDKIKQIIKKRGRIKILSSVLDKIEELIE